MFCGQRCNDDQIHINHNNTYTKNAFFAYKHILISNEKFITWLLVDIMSI